MSTIKKVQIKTGNNFYLKDFKKKLAVLASLVVLLMIAFVSITSMAQDDPGPLLLSDDKTITAFTIENQIGETIIIDNETTHTITLTMPFGTNLDGLIANFTFVGASLKVDEVLQETGVTMNNFNSDVIYRVTADNATFVDFVVTVTSLNNAVPLASNISITGGNNVIVDGAIMLAENSTTELVISATVSDANGREDIDNVRAKLYRTTVGAEAADNPNNHYTKTSNDDCVSEPGADNTKVYTCTFQLAYYAEATDVASMYESDNWTYEIIPSDESLGISASGTIEVATLVAMSVTPSIDYGAFSKGTNTLYADQITTITNTGNTRLAIQVFGYGETMDPNDGQAMICDSGTVPLANERYATLATTAYDSKISLTDTSTQINDFFVDKKTSDAAASANVYWGFAMPADNVSGSCHGKVIFTPIPSNAT